MLNMRTDLHIHTSNSDGTYTTCEIIEKLKKLKVKLFSITDHDDVTSCKEMENIFLPDDMIYIPGIEFSAMHNNYNCHILGYGIDCANKDLLAECALIKDARRKKIIQVLEYIRDKFSKVNYRIITEKEEKSILNKKGTIGRYDICEILKKKPENQGLKRSEIYDKYLTPKDLIVHRVPSKIIIDTIHKAKGQAILAHPREIEDDYQIDIERIIKELIDEGLDGIEVFNSIHTLEDVKRYKDIAKKYHLQTTGGSDFHGPTKPKITLGTTTREHIKIKENDIFFLY